MKQRLKPIPRPLLKWAGGKAFSAGEIIAQMPKKFGCYYEPFFGGGALFFELSRRGLIKDGAVLSDSNREVIDLLAAVRDTPTALVVAIEALDPDHVDADRYVEIRDSSPTTIVDRAARTLFVNKTCFNGLYRVNKSGIFNVGWNKKASWRPDTLNLYACSEALQKAAIKCVDYRSAVDDAERGDLVYLDPTYFPVSKTANFTAYTRRGFTHADQLKLAGTFTELASRRVTVLASNADVPAAREIYGSIPGATIHRLECPRRVNSDGAKRGMVSELLIVANGNKTRAAQAAE